MLIHSSLSVVHLMIFTTENLYVNQCFTGSIIPSTFIIYRQAVRQTCNLMGKAARVSDYIFYMIVTNQPAQMVYLASELCIIMDLLFSLVQCTLAHHSLCC